MTVIILVMMLTILYYRDIGRANSFISIFVLRSSNCMENVEPRQGQISH